MTSALDDSMPQFPRIKSISNYKIATKDPHTSYTNNKNIRKSKVYLTSEINGCKICNEPILPRLVFDLIRVDSTCMTQKDNHAA